MRNGFLVDGEQLIDSSVSIASDVWSIADLPTDSIKFGLGSSNMEMRNGIPPLQTFQQTAGIFGIGFEGISSINCGSFSLPGAHCSNIEQLLLKVISNAQTNQSIQSDQWRVALDFNLYGRSYMSLGGVNVSYSDAIVWSEFGTQRKFRAFHNFHVFNPKICGQDLFGGKTNSWLVEIDTESSCLGLPTEFFDVLVTWLPLNCTRGSNSEGRSVRVCFVLPQYSGERVSLPILQFSLNQEGSSLLMLPLEDLILPSVFTINGQNRLCLVEKYAFAQAGIPNIYKRITLGSRAISSLYTVLDFNTTRVGLTQAIRNRRTNSFYNGTRSIPPAEWKTDSRCSVSVKSTCSEHQIYNGYLNLCENIKCSEYLLYQFDSDSGKCRMHPFYQFVLFVGVGILTLLEIIVYLVGTKEILGIL